METAQFESPVHSRPEIGQPANADEDRILSAAQKVLRSRGHLVPDDYFLQLNDGKLTIRGSVPSFYHKQLAQELVRKVQGVRSVTNLLQVGPP